MGYRVGLSRRKERTVEGKPRELINDPHSPKILFAYLSKGMQGVSLAVT